MAILTSADWPSVRAAIDVSLTSDVVADSVIALSIYSGAAEAELLARDPIAASRTGSDADAVNNAAIYLCAARLAAAIPALASERLGEYQYNRAIDYNKRSQELRQLADAMIASVLAPVSGVAKPVFFTLASGRRGR